MLSMIFGEKTPLEERGKEREKPFVIIIMKHLHSSLANFFMPLVFLMLGAALYGQ